MAVIVIDEKHLVGLSTDAKPTNGGLGGFKPDALFWEYDTGDNFVWTGMSWVKQVAEVTLVDASGVAIVNPGGSLNAKDSGAAWSSVFGVSGVPVAITNQTVTAITDAPTSGQKIVLDDLVISTDTAQNIAIKEETSGTLFMPTFYMSTNSTIQITLRDTSHKLATANKKLTATCSAASHNTSILAGYHSEA